MQIRNQGPVERAAVVVTVVFQVRHLPRREAGLLQGADVLAGAADDGAPAHLLAQGGAQGGAGGLGVAARAANGETLSFPT